MYIFVVCRDLSCSFWLYIRLSSGERMLQGSDEGLSPTWTPTPLLSPDPRPSEPSAPPSHHEPAVPRAPEAAGGVSHGRGAAHLALPAGWKPGEWVRAALRLDAVFSRRCFIITEWSCGSDQREHKTSNYQMFFCNSAQSFCNPTIK